MTTVPIECERIDVRYGSRSHAIRDLSWSTEAGELHVLLGESGCGKTSLLRAIAGFERIMAGTIRLGGELVDDAGGRWIPPERRRVGMVFQDYALFPHLRVEENIRFGARSRELAKRLQASVGLAENGDRSPDTLSGGQQQRVALARALASEPKLLLLDEPFSNLDPSLRASLRELSRDMVKEQGLTAVLVTHDAADAFSLADRISVMHQGRILQTGEPSALYHAPTSAWVAKSLGLAQYLAGELGDGFASTALGKLPFIGGAPAGVGGDDGAARARDTASPAALLLRPEQLVLDPEGHPARCVSRTFMGPTLRVAVELPGGDRLLADLDPRSRIEVGDELRLSVRGEVCWVPDARA